MTASVLVKEAVETKIATAKEPRTLFRRSDRGGAELDHDRKI